MGLSYDFSLIIRRLDKSMRSLHEEEGPRLFLNNPPLVRESNCPLRECLEEMSMRGLRTCLVRYSNGLNTHSNKRKCLIKRSSPTGGGFSPAPPDASSKLDLDQGSIDKTAHDQSSETAHVAPDTVRDEKLDRWAHETYEFLDMRDVLCLLLEQYAEVYGTNGEMSDRPARDFLDELLSVQVGDVANMSMRNGFAAVYDYCTLCQLLKKFETASKVLVFQYEENGDKEIPTLIGIFSVIDLLQLLNTLSSESPTNTTPAFTPGEDPLTTFHMKDPWTALDLWTASMIKVAIQPPRATRHNELLICFEDEPLVDVMRVLHVTGFSAIPIVSRANPRRCSGIFSVRDLQVFLLQHSELVLSGALLNIPILDYISSIRRMQSLKARYPITHVRKNATIDAVIGKILATNVRRLLLTDNDGLLTDILSVTDLGRFVAKKLTS